MSEPISRKEELNTMNRTRAGTWNRRGPRIRRSHLSRCRGERTPLLFQMPPGRVIGLPPIAPPERNFDWRLADN